MKDAQRDLETKKCMKCPKYLWIGSSTDKKRPANKTLKDQYGNVSTVPWGIIDMFFLRNIAEKLRHR